MNQEVWLVPKYFSKEIVYGKIKNKKDFRKKRYFIKY
jgi:hypothetical protein